MEQVMGAGVALCGEFFVQNWAPDGQLKWAVREKNLVVNAGITKMLQVLFAGCAVVSTWYVGLAGSSLTAASGDTMASHAGWTEITGFGTATRAVFVDVISGKAVTNSASTVAYAINTANTIGGAFLASTNNKGGSTGTLLCVVTFTAGDKAATAGDTLTVTYSFSAADA